MTFETSPSAIDGARLNSALVRRATFAGVNGAAGIALASDLKVSALDVPGVGIQIAPGVALVRNGYQTVPNETYVASNPDIHVVPSGSMPAANPATKSYIVAVVIGDKAFSQVGHPFMLATDPPSGQETTFAYVRVVLIEVPAASTSIPGATYPYYALARIDYPASTTTVTNGMITDLRALAQPRSDQQIFVNTFSGATNAGSPIPSGSAYADWSTYQPQVKIPSWAKRMIVRLDLVGVFLGDTSVNVTGGIKVLIGATAGPVIGIDNPTASGGIRTNFALASSIDCTALQGTTQTLKFQAYEQNPASPTTNQILRLIANSQAIFDVRFFEQ